MNPYDILKYGQRTLHRSLNGVPEEEWETGGACGVWSCKDILSHLASYEHALEDVLKGFLGGGDTPTLTRMRAMDPDAFNHDEVASRSARHWREVLAELDEAHQRVMVMVPQIAPETWRQTGTLPWYGDEYALDDYIVYTYYGHKREHAAQINVFKDNLKR